MPLPARRLRFLGLLLVPALLTGCGSVDADPTATTSGAPAATPDPTAKSAPTAPTAPAAAPQRPLLYVIGDSYVEGTVQNTGPEFPVLTAQRLGGWRVASDGLGSTGYLARLDGRPKYADRLPQDLAHRTPGFLVVAGGANDRDLPLDEVIDEARDFFTQAYALRPWMRLVVISPWVPVADAYRPELDAALRRLTREVGGTWVDTHTWFTDRPELIGSDHDHPNQAGQRFIAGQLAPVLREVARTEP